MLGTADRELVDAVIAAAGERQRRAIASLGLVPASQPGQRSCQVVDDLDVGRRHCARLLEQRGRLVHPALTKQLDAAPVVTPLVVHVRDGVHRPRVAGVPGHRPLGQRRGRQAGQAGQHRGGEQHRGGPLGQVLGFVVVVAVGVEQLHRQRHPADRVRRAGQAGIERAHGHFDVIEQALGDLFLAGDVIPGDLLDRTVHGLVVARGGDDEVGHIFGKGETVE